jgi:hypothetical protein
MSHTGNESLRVNLQEFVLRRRTGVQQPDTAEDALLFQSREDALEPAGVLRMAGLIMLQVDRMVNVGSIHGVFLCHGVARSPGGRMRALYLPAPECQHADLHAFLMGV